ncbi:MAG: hypothetical protein JO356_14760 [Acidobacteria bacterium]|nr:hypothetical protein [Acidobacteriota bacterium]
MNAPDYSSRDDVGKAQELALRYRCEFVNLHKFNTDSDVLNRIHPGLMFRYSFVPLEVKQDGRLAIAVADPSQLMQLDEISLLLGRPLIVRVATLAQINEILQRIDPNPKGTTRHPPDEQLGPGAPDAPVCPRKPRPDLRSGAARAIPDEEH